MLDDAAEEDVRCVRQVLAGEREAFGRLVARYGRRVHDLARRMLRDTHAAEDVVQQAFLNAYRALPRYDPRRPFRHWLLRIASNLCRNHLAGRRSEPRALGDAEDADAPRHERPDPAPPGPDGDERAAPARVRAALEALPAPYRLAAVLRYAQGLSLDEIAEITGEPMGTVKIHLHRARAALRTSLEGAAPHETSRRTAGTDPRR